MAWRLRKRLRLARGVYLNLGKTGASLTMRSRFGSYTIGRRGQRASIDPLPGSGLSYSAYEPFRAASLATSTPLAPAPRPAAGRTLRIALAAIILLALAAVVALVGTG